MTSGWVSSGAQHRFLPVGRFRNDLKSTGFGQQGTNALAHNGMIVNNQNSNRMSHSVTSTVSRVPSPGLLS